MFLIELCIRKAFGFADYELGGTWGSDTESHFGCIINLLWIHFWIYYYLLILLIYFIINYYSLAYLLDKVLIIIN